jgi:hypothetical protein
MEIEIDFEIGRPPLTFAESFFAGRERSEDFTDRAEMLASRESTRSEILTAMFAQIQNSGDVRSIRILSENGRVKNFRGGEIWEKFRTFFAKN